MFRTLILATLLLAPVFSQAQDAHLFRRTQTSCSARSIDRFYCPMSVGDYGGPYFDNGCSVKCKSTQKATCREASCEESQTGQPVYSKCSCN
jgi:hypothetical protein